jgi:hypothetical protein
MPDKTYQLSELVVCIQRASDIPTYAPMHAGTVHRRLVGKDVHGATPVKVGFGVLAPGGMAEHHRHAAQEHTIDRLEECALWRSAPPLRRESSRARHCTGASAAFPEPRRPQRSWRSYHTPSGGVCPVPGSPRGAAPALLRCTPAGAGTSQAGSRMVKTLEPGLTAEFTTPPSPKLWLACCPRHPVYSPPSEGKTGGGREAYELEDLASIHHGDGRSGTPLAQ